jgi:hypothetical protein
VVDDFPSNSNKSKQEPPETAEKKVEKIASGVIKKQGIFRRMTSSFISRDLPDVKSYIILDVLIPAFKKAISDIIRNGIDMLLYGETDGYKRGGSPASRVSYRSYSDDRAPRSESRAINSRYGFSCEEIEFPTYGQAKDVLDRMYELLAMYKIVSIADFKELAGIEGSHTDNKYGWSDLAQAETVRTRDGYSLKMPRAMPIN